VRILKKIFKIILYTVLVLLVLANIFILVTGRFYVYRAVYYTYLHGQSGPGIFDQDYFYSRTVKHDEPNRWPYSTAFKKIKPSKKYLQQIDEFKTTGFLVIQSDSILFEKYANGGGENTVSNSFSVAKSVVTMLAGCALKDGKIKSLDQPVKDFIPWINEEAGTVTIRHLMGMCSGMEWGESGGNPLSDNAEAYYGTDLQSHLQRISFTEKAGDRFVYKSGNTELLGLVISKAVGKTLSEYASEKLWIPMGAESDAFWSLDSKNGVEKYYCCMYATLRDFARFGKLMLHEGNWNGNQILDTAFVRESLQPVAPKDEYGDKNTRYGLGWWMLDHKGEHVFYMRGILGQYVICIPARQLIIVRTGHKRGEKVNDLPQDLLVYIEAGLSLARK
jgi:CubicO group peptidase (beta-lactamase class C family)